MSTQISIRTAQPSEYAHIGQLMVKAYSQLEGFITPAEHPGYYNMMANIGDLTAKHGTEIIAAMASGKIVGAVVYFNNMEHYGSGGTATKEKNSAGFRFLAVAEEARGQGIGKLLTLECIRKTKEQNLKQLIIHTTLAMQDAWRMYERIGFKRSTDLDFMQGEMKVFGFRYQV
ncbi:MAG TPA: GNAT family N-acetyltransferase [Chryseosolibacter sp.]